MLVSAPSVRTLAAYHAHLAEMTRSPAPEGISEDEWLDLHCDRMEQVERLISRTNSDEIGDTAHKLTIAEAIKVRCASAGLGPDPQCHELTASAMRDLRRLARPRTADLKEPIASVAG